jgi:hypothetical protein
MIFIDNTIASFVQVVTFRSMGLTLLSRYSDSHHELITNRKFAIPNLNERAKYKMSNFA